jgi:hypothetical protein
MEAKRAAAVAGVLRYLAVQPGISGAKAGFAGFHASPWALYGRQTIMNQRIRMQARRRA